MSPVFALGVIAFILCFILTPICRDLSLRFDLVDRPDGDRKFHAKPIPRIGGVPIVLAYCGAIAAVFVTMRLHGGVHVQHGELLRALLPAVGIIFMTGLIDDIFGLKPWQKLAGQLAAAYLVTKMGLGIDLGNLAAAHRHTLLASPWVNVPLSILWLVACTNAVNLIDGLDGLAAGVGLFATVTTMLVGLFYGNTGLVLATMPLAGCLLAFLCFNFNPASVFLGDSGSLTIGFMLGCFSLVWGRESHTLLGMAAPLMALALPLIDVSIAVCRRFLRKVPIFKGDRGHIHHMVLARGFAPHQAALLLYGVCAVAASLALLQSFGRHYVRAGVIAVFVMLVWAGIKYLDYIELGAARRIFSQQRVLRIVRDEIFLHDLGRSIQNADSTDACWRITARVLSNMGFFSIKMRFAGSNFELTQPAHAPDFEWKIMLALEGDDFLALSRGGHDKAPKLMISTLNRLQEALLKKDRGFRDSLTQSRTQPYTPSTAPLKKIA